MKENKKGFVYMMTEKGHRTVKIGFTTNINQRLANYATHSSMNELLDVMTGDMALESELIARLEDDFGLERKYNNGHRTDFFKVPDEYREAMLTGFNFFNM